LYHDLIYGSIPAGSKRSKLHFIKCLFSVPYLFRNDKKKRNIVNEKMVQRPAGPCLCAAMKAAGAARNRMLIFSGGSRKNRIEVRHFDESFNLAKHKKDVFFNKCCRGFSGLNPCRIKLLS